MPFLSAKVTALPRNNAGQFIAQKLTPAITAGVTVYANTVLAEAQAIVPVRTGALRDSGKVVVNEQSRRVTAYVTFTAPYAGYVEYGTGRAGASSAGAGPYPYTLSWPGMTARPF